MNLFFTIIKENYIAVLTYIFSLTLIAFLTSSVIFWSHIQYVHEEMQENIHEYDEIDREHLCNIARCEYVLYKNKQFKSTNNILYVSEDKITKIYNRDLLSLYKVNGNFELAIYNKKSNSDYIMDLSNFYANSWYIFFIFLPLSVMLYIIPLTYTIKKDKRKALASMAGKEALLLNKSMIMITENIHHEMNTPLEVIDNKIEKVHKLIRKHVNENQPNSRAIDKQFIKLEEDFNYIKMASEQIYNVLEKMKGFKHLRYSNGNKTMKNIVEGAFKMIQVSNTNYNYHIDKNLKKVQLNSTRLTNADMLNILINHIKNSLEANANKIFVMINKIEKNYLYLRVIDNGSGIEQKNIKSVFNPNFSTKKSINITRGNGMYLNSYLLNSAGGTIKIIDTSIRGTTIELKIPISKG